jgi:hypothetical protein
MTQIALREPGFGAIIDATQRMWCVRSNNQVNRTLASLMPESNSAENPVPAPATEKVPEPAAPVLPKEIGGRTGPEPTRYGDWEKDGRCIDF